MKNKLKILLIIIVTSILVGELSAYAAYKYAASEVKYKKADGTEINVNDALNELYKNGNNKKKEIIGTVWKYDYSNTEVMFMTPCAGKYKLEVWGAQGASYSANCIGGYGGYAVGEIDLPAITKLYINVGGAGSSTIGGYNGGANANNYSVTFAGGGGGATHIATSSGVLKNLSEKREDILIVAGGGAGAYTYSGKVFNVNSGGGYIGGYSYDSSTPGKQDSGYSFGQAGSQLDAKTNYSGAGGGYYGGKSYWGEIGSGGGSGYLSENLVNKHMGGYNCTTSEEESIKTNKLTSASRSAETDKAKIGNGYVKITLVE